MLLNLQDVFQNRIFRIPGYQRGYSWETKHIEQLWNDIQNINYPFPENANHFTGTLTLNKFSQTDLNKIEIENHGYQIFRSKVKINGESFTPYHLVDGQQRLTTLLILLSILIDAILTDANCNLEIKKSAENSKKKYLILLDEDNLTKHLFGYETDVPSHEYLLNNIFNDLTVENVEPETLYTNRLGNARDFFIRKLINFQPDEKERLFNKIEDRLLFSLLILNETNDRKIDVSMAFETLNFRGKTLSVLELFKNRVLYLISKRNLNDIQKSELSKNVIDTWLIVYKWLGKNHNKELNDDDFLKAFWLLYFSEASMVSEDFKGWNNDIFTNIFSLENNPNQNLNISTIGLDRWLRVARKAIELWFIIKNPLFFTIENDAETEFYLSDEIKSLLFKINSLNIGAYTQNLILAILYKNLPTKKDFAESDDLEANLLKLKKIIKYLNLIDRHNYACFLLNGNQTNLNRERIFRCINSYYKTGNGAIKRNDTIDYVNLEAYLNDDLVNINFEDIKRHVQKDSAYYSWDGRVYFLIHWEIYLAKQKNIELNFEDLRAINWHTKLIYPDYMSPHRINFESINARNLTTRDKYSYSLGNLFLSKNASLHTNLEHLQHNITNNPEHTYNEKELLTYENVFWNEEKIIERGKKMFIFAIENWDLTYINNIQNPRNYSQTKWEEILLG